MTIESIDSFVKSTENRIKNNELEKKKTEDLKSFANHCECFYENGKLTKIWALDGSPYGLTYFKFYILNEQLVYSDIEFCELKKEYWDTMNPVIFDKNNSVYDYEKTYFLDKENSLTKNNDEPIQELKKEREKVILEQYSEVIELLKQEK